MPHPGLATYFGYHAIKWSLNSRDNSVKSLQGVELALETAGYVKEELLFEAICNNKSFKKYRR